MINKGKILIFLMVGIFTWLFAQSIEEGLKTGEEKFKKGDYKGAIQTYDKILEEKPYHLEALQKRAKNRRYIGNLNGAMNDYNTALGFNANLPNAYIGRAQTKLRIQAFESAIQDFETALRIQPLSKHKQAILYNKGWASHQIQQLDSALQNYSKALEINPENTKALVNRGVILYKKGQIRAACMDWIKARDLGNRKAESNLQKACKCCI